MQPTPATAETIFGEAIAISSADERAAYLDRACRSDHQLRAEIDRLVADHFQAGSFLEAPAIMTETGARPIGCGNVGEMIGPYKLLQQIGEGGMGVVYMAEQAEPVKRRVALKIIKPGMDTQQVIARFEAERQALSLMDHPNIAKVLDAGTTESGRPYFVMELVKGQPITQYCDEHHLTPRQRLELLLPVCQAIQHAHQKGIIHRDIKPTNILVAEYDQQPVPKVIDFGVAKAISQPLTEKTMFTGLGQIVGTLEYMSPEQAKVNQLDIDTRSDIYSLGVLLYELLTGSTPFDKHRLRSAAFDEMLRIIREEEPPKPSTRLSDLSSPHAPREETAGSGTRSVPTTLASIAAVRSTEPARLTKLVRGELDWIVMKALDKDRSRRYETASALAADVRRYLDDEPVVACPPSAGYRLRKFARKNRAAMTTAAAILVAVLLAVGSLAVSYLRIEESLQHEKKVKEDLVQSLYYQRIASAASARANEQAGRAEELLDQCPSELRGWEWHYLKRLPFADFPTFHLSEIVTTVAVSRDGRLLAAGNNVGTVKVWDVETGKELCQLPKHGKFIRGLAFSPDGLLLATGCEADSGIVKIWNPLTGELKRELPDHTFVLIDLTFSPDGRFLATACPNDQVRLWDVSSGKLLDAVPEKSVACCAFSPDSRRLLTACADGKVKVYDASTGQPISSFQGKIQLSYAAAFSQDCRLVALGSEDGTVKVWETASGKEIHSLEAHSGLVIDLAFLANDRRLASCGDDRTLKIWDMATGQEALQLGVFPRRSQALAVSTDGLRLFYRHPLATLEAGDTIGIADGTPLMGGGGTAGNPVFTGHLHSVVALAWSPNGQRLASASWDTSVKVWDVRLAREQLTLRGHAASLTDVAWSPDGQLIASASGDETVRVWNAETGDELFTLRGKGGPVHGVAFHPKDGRTLASAHNDGTIRFWDTTSGKKIRDFPAQKHPVLGVAYSPDGELLVGAAGKNMRTIPIWNAASGAQRMLLPKEAICFSAAFSPDGQLVAAVASTNDVCVWDVATGELRRKLTHPLRPNRVAFCRDSRLLATVSLDSKVRLWDVFDK